jgi:hypothetical protein
MNWTVKDGNLDEQRKACAGIPYQSRPHPRDGVWRNVANTSPNSVDNTNEQCPLREHPKDLLEEF